MCGTYHYCAQKQTVLSAKKACRKKKVFSFQLLMMVFDYMFFGLKHCSLITKHICLHRASDSVGVCSRWQLVTWEADEGALADHRSWTGSSYITLYLPGLNKLAGRDRSCTLSQSCSLYSSQIWPSPKQILRKNKKSSGYLQRRQL